MEYFICTEVRMKCVICATGYNIQVKDTKPIDIFNVKCECGGEVKEVDEHGNIKR